MDFDTIRSWVSREGRGPVRPLLSAVVLAGGYAVTVITWLLLAAWIFWDEVVVTGQAAVLVIVNGSLFVAITTTVLFVVIERYLTRLKRSEESFAQAQAELRHKDLAVRQGYVDVLDAVTGGKLILITRDELDAIIGVPILPAQAVPDKHGVAGARRAVSGAVAQLPLADKDEFVLAVSEAVTNAVKHGGRGEVAAYRSGDCIQVLVRDPGPGIDFRELPKATLIQGFSTTNTMGLGFTIMLEVCDRVLLTTDSGGTVVVLEIELAGAPAEERTLEAIL